MYTLFLIPGVFLALLPTTYAINPRIEWKEDWSARMPSRVKRAQNGWVGYRSGDDGGNYMENGWQDSWQSGNNNDDSGWNKKRSWGNSWTRNGKHKWSWGNGGAQGWGVWGNDAERMGDQKKCCDGFSMSSNWMGLGPEQSYMIWSNVNSNSWKNNGGGEGWSKWEVDSDGSNQGNQEQGGWKGWKNGFGGGNWKSWKSSNRPSAQAEAYASASTDR